MFEGVDTFTVVRNPYSLMLSEYYYLFQKKPHLVEDIIKDMKEGELNDPAFMNRWIVGAMDTAMKRGICYFAHCIPSQVRLCGGRDAVRRSRHQPATRPPIVVVA